MRMKTKSKFVGFRMLDSQESELDRFAKKYGQSKSDLIREAIQVWLGTQWQKERSNEGRDDAMA